MSRILTLVCIVCATTASPVLAQAPNERVNTSPALQRFVLLVAHNRGAPSRAPLRYAESDARKMAEVLRELGDVDPQHLVMVLGQGRAAIDAGFQRLRDAITRARTRGSKTSLLFYFSGHSDGRSLELGTDTLTFAEVREAMEATRTDIRLAILDSCKSGGLVTSKGGTPGPSFDIQFANGLESSGEAVITSSAPDEVALESLELRASFFSHHLLTGMRGAADKSGDGVVSLAEAYEYAFMRTVRATSDTSMGTQHPSYDYRLNGQGEVMLTRLDRPNAQIEIPGGFARILVVHTGRDEVLAELGPAGALRLAVVAGSFKIYGRRQTGMYVARLTLAPGERHRLSLQEFAPAPLNPKIYSKGDPANPPTVERPNDAAMPGRLFVGAGASGAVAARILYAPGVWVGWVGQGTFPPTVEFGYAGTTAGPPEFRESHAIARVGWRARVALGPVSLSAGAEVGGGIAWQSVVEGPKTSSWLVTWGAGFGVEVPVGLGADLGVWVGPAQGTTHRDGDLVVFSFPRAYAGLGWRL